MSEAMDAELVWTQQNRTIAMAVFVSASQAKAQGWSRYHHAVCGGVSLPVVHKHPAGRVLYRHPTRLHEHSGQLHTGPVFAILAGNRHFTGSRSDFRDVLQTGREHKAFIYVLPTECVSKRMRWTGYVRTGPKRWLAIPCPRPEAVYNRIPNRVLEVNQAARGAKEQLRRLTIPMFNPGYFSKAEIYHVLRQAGLEGLLPRTVDQMTWPAFIDMLRRYPGVYLKPTASSVGHGIMRVDKEGRGLRVRVLKNLQNSEYHADSIRNAWGIVQEHRILGKYVIQQAIPLTQWEGKPCDVRVLLQKQGTHWEIVGKGVRVAGAKSITTHVPTGGSIVGLSALLEHAFSETATQVEAQVDELALSCANAIDAHYDGKLGEMSMDVGLDNTGHVWLFEANSKPMKFDEPLIRSRSLNGVLRRLMELRRSPHTG